MSASSHASHDTSLRPTDKVATAGLAGAVVTLVVFLVGLFGVDIPAEVAAALTTVLVFVTAYVRPEHHPAS